MTKTTIVLLFLFFFTLTVFSQTRISTDFKDYRLEVIKLNNINHLDVNSQHARINLLNWDKDSISIETNIEILSDKPNLAKEMLHKVHINIQTYGNTLQVKTSLSSDFRSTIPYKINYNIFFPKELSVSLKNTHGEVNLADVEGGIQADIRYCQLNIKNLSASNDTTFNHLNITHCKGRINHLGNAHANISQSQLTCIDAKHLDMNSSYSILTFQEVKNYQGQSNIDRINLESTDKITLKAISSTVIVNNFNQTALFECQKGSLNIGGSSPDFSQLTINNDNTKTTVQLNPQASYTINGEITKGKLLHPQLSNLQIINEENKSSFSGDIGTSTDSHSKVIVFNNKQNIAFK